MSFSSSKTVLLCGGCGEEMKEGPINFFHCPDCKVQVNNSKEVVKRAVLH